MITAAVWTMGNLGRAGYGATTEGMWPYSYDSCDLGTFPNQTNKDHTPAAAATGGSGGGPLSFLPGQRLSACTCPDSDHPGPSFSTGRGVPEIDIFETQIDTSRWVPEVSQSMQTAPYNAAYQFDNSSSATTIYDATISHFNTYKGGLFQQAVSTVTDIDGANYNNSHYATYGFEWFSDPSDRASGYVTWFSQGTKAWTATAATVGADSATQISSRLISEEPMVRNLRFLSALAYLCQKVHHLQLGNVAFFPRSRLQTLAVPFQDVRRLRARLSAGGCEQRCGRMQSPKSSDGRLHSEVRTSLPKDHRVTVNRGHLQAPECVLES
jgi:beta-glucan synthesis-associated protein KRE6